MFKSYFNKNHMINKQAQYQLVKLHIYYQKFCLLEKILI